MDSLMKGSKYSDCNLFFEGTRKVYSTRDYISDAREKRRDKEVGVRHTGRKQLLSKEDEKTWLMIKNRDLVDPRIRKVDSDNCQLGKFVD